MIFKELKHSMRIISLQVENNNKKDVNYKRETNRYSGVEKYSNN